MIKKLLLLVALLFVLAGCAVPESDDSALLKTQTVEVEELNIDVKMSTVDRGNLTRIIDVDASVVCYVHRFSTTSAISCLPLSETSLDY